MPWEGTARLHALCDHGPRSSLRVLQRCARALNPACAPQVANLLNEETAQLYALCGRGPRSSLRVLRHGLAVAEMAVSELPGNPTAVWTIRRSATDELDAYIIVSFTNATLARPSWPPMSGDASF